MVWIVIVIVLRVRQMDEYQVKLFFPGLAVGFAVAMVAAVTVGTSQLRRVHHPQRRMGRGHHRDRGLGVHQPRGRSSHRLMENLIRSEREQRGWTQAVLAERLEVSRQTVVALETGKYDPSLPLAFRISRLFEKTSKVSSFPADS